MQLVDQDTSLCMSLLPFYLCLLASGFCSKEDHKCVFFALCGFIV